MSTRWRVTAATDTGRVRTENQDRLVAGSWLLGASAPGVQTLHFPVTDPLLVAVIDGMGGHPGGAEAAHLAAEALVVASPAGVVDAVRSANDAVYAGMDRRPELRGMGATVAAVSLVGDEMTACNVGDSRVYVETSGLLIQVSEDDSVRDRGALTQSLGGMTAFEDVEPHVAVEALYDRRVLLASDGVFGHVDSSELESVMHPDDVECVARLLQLALERGGPDNITVALISTEADDQHG